MPNLDELQIKYASVLELIRRRNVRLDHLHMQDGKLFLQGAAANEAVKNQIWDQIKVVDASYSDLTCDLSIESSIPALADPQESTTYTVQFGDSLWKISQHFYGAGNLYKKIIEANPDKLKDENSVIHPGDKLKVPF